LGVLAGHRIGYGFFQRSYAVPLIGRTHAAVAADLIDTPVDFQGMIIGIATLHGDLATGASPAFEVDLRAVRTQAIAGADDLCQGRDLESEMVQFPVGVFPSPAPTNAKQ
jgi:hypothetical protein